jgi:hypothetical protein
VYVDLGTGAGTGSRDAPFHSLADALAATPPPATILVRCGTYALAASASLSAAITIRGVSPTATIFTPPRGAPAFEVGATDGAPVAVTLARFGVRGDAAGDGGTDARVPGIRVGPGATLTLDDVAIENTGYGVRVEQATLCAQGLSVRRARTAGLSFVQSKALVRDFLIRDGANLGVLADESLIALRQGLVANNARDGVALRGTQSSIERCAPPDADAGTPGTACPQVAVCPGFMADPQCVPNLPVPPGPGEPGIAPVGLCRGVSTLEDVAIVGNHVTGLRAERMPPLPTATVHERNLALSQPGSIVQGARLVLGDTRAVTGESGGDGLYVGPSARVTLDPNIASEDAGVPGSFLVGNTRTGALVDGDRSTGASDGGIPNALQTHGTLRMAGALVSANRGPGLYVQERSVAERVAFVDFVGNAALGLGVTSGGSAPLIQCGHFIGTRTSTLMTETLGPITIGDGLSMSEGSDTARIEGCRFENNQRYGLLLSGFNADFIGRNTARQNPSGVGVFGGNVTGSTADLSGFTTTGAPPRDVARGAQSTPATNR